MTNVVYTKFLFLRRDSDKDGHGNEEMKIN